MSDSNSGSALSMRERAEIDAAYGRVRAGEHYTALGVAEDAPLETIQRSHAKLTRWLETLETLEDHPELLGDYPSRVRLIAHAVQNAWRILGNPLMRLRYDEQRRFGEGTDKGPSTSPRILSPEAHSSREGSIPTETVVMAQRASRVQGLGGEFSGRKAIPSGASGAVPDARAGLLVALLEAHLGAAFGGAVSLAPLGGETAAVYGRRAEDAEARGDWLDSVALWHAALLASPEDVKLVRRAASAMKAAGASSNLLRGYNHRADVMDQSGPAEAGRRKPLR